MKDKIIEILKNNADETQFESIAEEIVKLCNVELRLFAKEMQNICVMDDRLPSDEYVDMWLKSL